MKSTVLSCVVIFYFLSSLVFLCLHKEEEKKTKKNNTREHGGKEFPSNFLQMIPVGLHFKIYISAETFPILPH